MLAVLTLALAMGAIAFFGVRGTSAPTVHATAAASTQFVASSAATPASCQYGVVGCGGPVIVCTITQHVGSFTITCRILTVDPLGRFIVLVTCDHPTGPGARPCRDRAVVSTLIHKLIHGQNRLVRLPIAKRRLKIAAGMTRPVHMRLTPRGLKLLIASGGRLPGKLKLTTHKKNRDVLVGKAPITLVGGP